VEIRGQHGIMRCVGWLLGKLRWKIK
jgi:hypothetical protein